jgi:type VI secretion system protein ImpF
MSACGNMGGSGGIRQAPSKLTSHNEQEFQKKDTKVMNGFEPTLFDKLFPLERTPGQFTQKLRAEEFKDTVARDLEALLNTRMVYTDEMLAEFGECQRSILTYGLCDFSNKSLSSHDDRAFICASLKNAISRHESRLKDVKVTMKINNRATSILCFSISAILDVGSAHESVSFDAMLQPTTLQYAVNRGRMRNNIGEQ